MSFSLQLNGFKKRALEKAERDSREIQLRLFRSIVMDTPVLEGTLRSNWQFTKDSPAEGELSSTDNPLQRIQQGLEAFRLGDTTYLSNNLPYAYRIEFYGWSHTKAPEGMVRKNTIRFRKIVRDVVRGSR